MSIISGLFDDIYICPIFNGTLMRNNGIINMATGKNFEAPNGVQVIIERGKIN